MLLVLIIIPFLFWGKRAAVFEDAAWNGLERWADNFESVIVAAPAIPEALAAQDKTMTICNLQLVD